MKLTCLSCSQPYEVPEGTDLRGVACPKCGTPPGAHFTHAKMVRFEAAGNAAYEQACGHARRGQKEPAFAALEEALAGGYDDFDFVDADPALAPLRSDPRYAEILGRYRRRR